MRMVWLVIGVLLLVAGDARAGQTVNFQGGPAHDGHVTGETFAPPLGVKWRTAVPEGRITHPVVADGRVIVGVGPSGDSGDPRESTVIAMAASDGHVLWSREIPGSRYYLGLAYEAGRVFVTGADATLHALSAATGEPLWSRTLDTQSWDSPPTASGGTVYAAGQGILHALAADTGAERWTKVVGAISYAAPTVGGGRVYVGAEQTTKAFSTDNGGHAWTHDRGNWYDSTTPVLAGGRLYVRGETAFGGTVLETAHGDPTGTFTSWSAPAIADGIALLSSDYKTLRAVDLASGSELWSTPDAGHPISVPLIVNGRAYVGAGHSGYAGIDLRSGEVVWKCAPSAGGFSGGDHGMPTGFGAGEGLLVAPGQRSVIAFSPGATGGCAEQRDAPAPFTPPPSPPTSSGGSSGSGSGQALQQGAGTIFYAGGVSPTRRRAGLGLGVARTGDAVVMRLTANLSCRSTSFPQLVARARGTASGDAIRITGRTKVVRGLFLRTTLDVRAVGEELQGTFTSRPVRRRGGPRGCGRGIRLPVRLRTQVTPAGAPVPAPANARLRGMSTQTAGGVRLPVLVSTGTGGRVVALWTAHTRCTRSTFSITNFTPATAVRADGSFARSERYRLKYRGGITEHYRVRFTGQFRADGVEGTLRASLRVTDRRGRTIGRCASGLQRYGAA